MSLYKHPFRNTNKVPKACMGSSSSVPESPRPLYALVYAPWHVDAPELLLHWKKCIEVRGRSPLMNPARYRH